MKRILISLSIISLITTACTLPQTSEAPKTQLQIREFQTRSYETQDIKMVMKAMLNVLQDDGYIVKNANTDLGLLTATKELDVESSGEAFFSVLLAGENARYKKNSVIECSANVSEFGKETRVRVNFQIKTMNNKAEVMTVKQVEDGNYYQTFFSKVDKGVFIQKEKL
jgi:hypothetical protein